MAFSKMSNVLTKATGAVAIVMLAGCMGGSNGGTTRLPQDIVDNLPEEIIPIVIENEDEIRDIIDTELDGDLQEQADEIVDLIVAVTTTTVAVTSVTTAAATD